MATNVYVVTCEGNIPFMQATDEQLENCERIVQNKRGETINRINPRDLCRIEAELEQKRKQLQKVLCCC